MLGGEEVADGFADGAVEDVAHGSVFRGVGDEIDDGAGEVGVAQRRVCEQEFARPGGGFDPVHWSVCLQDEGRAARRGPPEGEG